MVAITSLPVDGDEVLYLHDILGTDLGFQVNKKNNTYSIYINTFNRWYIASSIPPILDLPFLHLHKLDGRGGKVFILCIDHPQLKLSQY